MSNHKTELFRPIDSIKKSLYYTCMHNMFHPISCPIRCSWDDWELQKSIQMATVRVRVCTHMISELSQPSDYLICTRWQSNLLVTAAQLMWSQWPKCVLTGIGSVNLGLFFGCFWEWPVYKLKARFSSVFHFVCTHICTYITRGFQQLCVENCKPHNQ